MSKNNYIFEYSRKLNGVTVIPNQFNIDENGAKISLINVINNTIGLAPTLIYNGDNVTLTFKVELDTSQQNNLTDIVNSYKTKSGYTQIESATLTYLNSSDFNSERFHTYLNTLRDEYNANGWSGITYTDKKIIAKNWVSNLNEGLEVYSQDELNDFKYYKIYEFITDDKSKNLSNSHISITPKSIDYKKDLRDRVHPEYNFDKHGFLTGVTYYENMSVTHDSSGIGNYTYSNPILYYSAEYVLGDDGYVKSRTVNRQWYLSDGTLSNDIKISNKYYQPLNARAEGRRRRKNLISELLSETVGLILMTSPDLNTISETESESIPFMQDIDSDISAYYEYGSKRDSGGNPCKLIQSISAHTFTRLDNFVPNTGNTVKIRDYIISRLDPQ